jgi:integrase/recombinase XerD
LKRVLLKSLGKGQRFVPIGSLAQKYIHIYKSTIRIHLNVKKEHGDVLFLNRRKKSYKSDDFTIIKDLAVKIELHKRLVTLSAFVCDIFSDLRFYPINAGHGTEIYLHLDRKF